MCEFKIIRKNNDTQILEDIVILSYNEEHELIMKDVIGMGEKLHSALILDVNTLSQKCVILENPLIKDFIELITKLSIDKANNSDVDELIHKLQILKGELK